MISLLVELGISADVARSALYELSAWVGLWSGIMAGGAFWSMARY